MREQPSGRQWDAQLSSASKKLVNLKSKIGSAPRSEPAAAPAFGP